MSAMSQCRILAGGRAFTVARPQPAGRPARVSNGSKYFMRKKDSFMVEVGRFCRLTDASACCRHGRPADLCVRPCHGCMAAVTTQRGRVTWHHFFNVSSIVPLTQAHVHTAWSCHDLHAAQCPWQRFFDADVQRACISSAAPLCVPQVVVGEEEAEDSAVRKFMGKVLDSRVVEQVLVGWHAATCMHDMALQPQICMCPLVMQHVIARVSLLACRRRHVRMH